jgi:hypothetical protein
MHNTIYIDPALKPRGHTARVCFEDGNFYASKGLTALADSSGGREPVIIVSLKGTDLEVIGGKSLVQKWDITAPGKNAEFCWSIIQSALSVDRLRSLMSTAHEKGIDEGKQEIRDAFHKLMGML